MVPKTFRSCGTNAMPARARASASVASMALPSKTIDPAERRSSPATALSSVDLPAPFGPMIETISPGPTVSEAPLRICSPIE